MGLWAPQSLGSSLSSMAVTDDAQDEAIRSHERGSTAPTSKPTGLLWDCTDSSTLSGAGLPSGDGMLRWNGSAWTGLMDLTQKQVNAGGTVTYGANQPMGGYIHTGLGAGSASGHSVRYEQVLLRSGANAMTGNLDAGSYQITNLAAPSSSSHAARLADIPTAIGKAWFNNNRDAAGSSKPVKTRTGSGDTTNFCESGFIPRKFTVRLGGTARRIDTDGSTGLDFTGDEFEFTVWPADATGGDTGQEYPYRFHRATNGSGVNLDFYVEQKSGSPEGFYVYFLYGTTIGGPGTVYSRIAKTGDSATDGTIQIFATREA